MPLFRTMIALAMLSATAAFAADTAKSYDLPGHGAFRLQVPEGWRDEVRTVGADLPPTISFTPVGGRRFEILVTPIWPMKGKAPASEDTLRGVVDVGLKEAQPRAVESQLAVKEVPGMPGRGYYFAATDRQPEPNGYTRMAQGAARVGTLTVTFTILTNSGQRDVVDTALAMIAAAEQVR